MGRPAGTVERWPMCWTRQVAIVALRHWLWLTSHLGHASRVEYSVAERLAPQATLCAVRPCCRLAKSAAPHQLHSTEYSPGTGNLVSRCVALPPSISHTWIWSAREGTTRLDSREVLGGEKGSWPVRPSPTSRHSSPPDATTPWTSRKKKKRKKKKKKKEKHTRAAAV